METNPFTRTNGQSVPNFLVSILNLNRELKELSTQQTSSQHKVMKPCYRGVSYSLPASASVVFPSRSMKKYRGVEVKALPSLMPNELPQIAMLQYRGACYIKSLKI